MAYKASYYIKSAMRLVGVLESGQDPTVAEQTDLLTIANDWLDSISTEGLALFTENRNLYSLVANKTSYTYGVGGNFNAARPVQIYRAGIISNNNPTLPLELPLRGPLTDDQWADIPVKAITSSLANSFWDDGGFPLRTIYFYPVPNVGGLQVAFYVPLALTQFADWNTTDYSFPLGYARFVRYNLAVEIANEWQGGVVSATIMQIAAESKANIKRVNKKVEDLKVDPALLSGKPFNWLTGE